jgi:hypothetical protein
MEPVSIRKTQRLQVVTYKTQPNAVNHLLVLFHGLQECDEHCVITADAENVSHLLEDKHSSFHSGFFFFATFRGVFKSAPAPSAQCYG